MNNTILNKRDVYDHDHKDIGRSYNHMHVHNHEAEDDHEHGHCHDSHDDSFHIEIGCGCSSCSQHTHAHGHSCGHENGHFHEHTHESGEKLFTPLFLSGTAAFAVGFVLNICAEWGILPEGTLMLAITLVLFIFSYICVGKNVILNSFRNIRQGEIFDENFLMLIASLGAFCIGEFPEAVAVMLFYNIGESLQDKAVEHSTGAIEALLDIRADEAELLQPDGSIAAVEARSVLVGETIVIKPGAKVPLDGVITDGVSSVNMQALTGESMPVDMETGDEILSGTVNGEGELKVKVTKAFGESTASKILDLVRNAASEKARTENFITRFAGYYTPAVVAAAVIIAVLPPLVTGRPDFVTWVYRALIFLVVSCPCALVVSIPLSFFSGIGAASRRGVMVKGGNYLESLSNVNTIVFDKTGTLTTGRFKVSGIVPAQGFDADAVLMYAAAAESNSTHPIAVSIMEEYNRRNGDQRLNIEVSGRVEKAGYGIEVKVSGRQVLVGNERLMEKAGVEADKENEASGTRVFVAVDGLYAGCILIEDTVRNDSRDAIEGLRALNVEKLAMLTGDNEAAAVKAASELGITEVYSDLLPQDKISVLETLCGGGNGASGGVAFVGDGINDAPSIARADVGIAMGGVGSDAAIEAADIVIMTDQPSKVPEAIRVARNTKRIVWQNIIFALAVKFGVMIFAAAGFANMWEAVFADVGVALLCVLNSLRIR